jgi:superfamily I DNA/RNA helicase
MITEVMGGFDKRSHLGAQVNALFNRLRIDDALYQMHSKDVSKAKKCIENIEQVVNSLAFYEEHNPRGSLSEFLERISLLDDQESDNDKEHGKNAVTLMSLHSSKGLEFDHVYLVGLEEELLPHKRSIEEDPTVAEERRLCYVGITRARKHLTISRCLTRRKYGEVEERKPSRFLAEIPLHLLNDTSCSAETSEQKSANLADDFFARMLGE